VRRERRDRGERGESGERKRERKCSRRPGNMRFTNAHTDAQAYVRTGVCVSVCVCGMQTLNRLIEEACNFLDCLTTRANSDASSALSERSNSKYLRCASNAMIRAC